MKIKVYSILTLAKPEVHRILPDATVAPPIQRGDLLKDIRRKFNVVVIIDGRFYHSLAVSPTEIMDALRCGLRIYGASSMGALRAAELDLYGMTGCGKIFEFIKRQTSFRDDFVGQSFDPATGRPVSTPYVDFHFNLETLVRRGTLDRKRCGILSRAFADLHYTDRNLFHLKSRLSAKSQNDPALLAAAVKAFKLGSQKRRDAIQTLHLVKSELESIQKANQMILQAPKGLRKNKFRDMRPEFGRPARRD